MLIYEDFPTRGFAPAKKITALTHLTPGHPSSEDWGLPKDGIGQ